jgi:hypothetical protein
VRWGVRVTLSLGVAASVAANILHAEPNPISQMIAAWPPLALLLTVELISRVPVHRRYLAAVRFAATAAIAGIAAWVSYWHMVGVVYRYGERGASVYLLPFSVDGLIVVASVCLVELAGRIRTTRELQSPPLTEAVPTEVPPAEPDTRPGPARVMVPVTIYPGAVPLPAHRTPEPTVAAPGPAAPVPPEPAAAPVTRTGTARPRRTDGVPAKTGTATARTARRRTGTAAGGRTDADLIAALADVPREPDGTVPVRRAAAALGAGPDRARRLLSTAGLLRADPTPAEPAGPRGSDIPPAPQTARMRTTNGRQPATDPA